MCFVIAFFASFNVHPGRERKMGSYIRGFGKLTGAGDFWGGARGYQGALELTDDFGKGY